MALLCLLAAIPASGQIVESVGSRALGMGGAFVAVASDSSATWWNPGGLAAGPFVDIAWAGGLVEEDRSLAASRHRSTWVALGTPPIGLSLYRFRITDIRPFDPIERAPDDRQDTRVGVPVRSISVTQLGVTLVRTLVTGVHAGTTLKYVRGTVHTGLGESPSGLLDLGESLDTGEAEGGFDLDMGVLAVAGPLRFGALMRNVREPEFTNAAPMGLSVPPVRLPRQVRAGVAFDAEATPTGLPLTVAFDGDLRSYETPSGPRQVVALGAEFWFLTERLGVRAGGRVNTKGGRERAATLGLSVAMRGGLFLDGHVVGGGSKSEDGWGLAARVSF